MRLLVLRDLGDVAVARRDVEEAGAVEREARTEAARLRTDAAGGVRPTGPALGDDDVLDLGQRAATVVLRPGHGQRRRAVVRHRALRRVGVLLRVREIDVLVLRVLGMQGHVEHAAKTHAVGFGHSGDWRRVEDTVAHDAQASRPLGDEQVTIGQESNAPGRIEIPDVGGHAIACAASTAVFPRSGSKLIDRGSAAAPTALSTSSPWGSRRTGPRAGGWLLRPWRGRLLRHSGQNRHHEHRRRSGRGDRR